MRLGRLNQCSTQGGHSGDLEIIMVILIMAMRQITPDTLDRVLGLLGELIAARGQLGHEALNPQL